MKPQSDPAPLPPARPLGGKYRGRFAPSPTGPLHFGSLVAAVGSYLRARAQGGVWLVRMEDLDELRTVNGASASILRDLERFGLEWDEPLVYQTHRIAHYDDAAAKLEREGHTFPCGCSRREIPCGVYPGTCRDGIPPGKQPRTVRMRVAGPSFSEGKVGEDKDGEDAGTHFTDLLQGPYRQDLVVEVGDFVIKRADGMHAYHLAVVVDDADQGITEVVRGADLLSSTPRQLLLQKCLGLNQPQYLHLPVAVNRLGRKLSKQTYAEPISGKPPGPLLWKALAFLGQDPPAALEAASTSELWAWALQHWRLEKIPGDLRLTWID